MIRRRMKLLVDREIRFKPVKLQLFNYERVCYKVRGQKEEEVIGKLIKHAIDKYDIPIEKILSDVHGRKRKSARK